MIQKKELDSPCLPSQHSSGLSTEPTISQNYFSPPKSTFCLDKNISSSSHFTQNQIQSTLKEPKLVLAPRNSKTNEDIIQQTLTMFRRIKHERNKTTGYIKQSQGQQPHESTRESSRSSSQQSISSLKSQSSSCSSDERTTSPIEDHHQVWDNSELKENGYFNLDQLTNFQVFKLRMMTYPCMRQPEISNSKVVQAFVKLQKISKQMVTSRITKQLKVDHTQNLTVQPSQGQASIDQIKQWQSDQTCINRDIALSESYKQFSSYFKATIEAEKLKQRPQKFKRYDKSTLEEKDIKKRGKELIKKQFLQLMDEHEQQISDLSPEKKFRTSKQPSKDSLDQGNAVVKSTQSRLSLTGTNSPDSNPPSYNSFSQIPQGLLSPGKAHNSPNSIITRHFLIRKVSESRQFNSTSSNDSPQSPLISKQQITQTTPIQSNLQLYSLDGGTANNRLTNVNDQGSNIPILRRNPSQGNNSNYPPSIMSQLQQYGRKMSSPILNILKTETPSFNDNTQKEVIPLSSNLPQSKRASSYHFYESSGQEFKVPFLNSLHKQNLDAKQQSKLPFKDINIQAKQQQLQQLGAWKIELEEQTNIESKNQISDSQKEYQPPNSPSKKQQSIFQKRIPSLHLAKQNINDFFPKASFNNQAVSDFSQETLIKSANFRLNPSPSAFNFNTQNIIYTSKSSSPHRKPFQQQNPSSYLSSEAVISCGQAPSSPYSLQRFKLGQIRSEKGNGVSLLKLISTQTDANSSPQKIINIEQI